MKRIIIPLALAMTTAVPAFAGEAEDAFFDNLHSMCGFNFTGEVVEDSTNDPQWGQALLLIDVVRCTDTEIDIKLAVGEDASRTWLIRRNEEGLSLHHDHRLEDGTPDEITMYGGMAVEGGTDSRQAFPADNQTKVMFEENGLEVSMDNTWVLIIEPGEVFSYRLERPGRTFQIDFDLHPPEPLVF